MPLRLSLRWPRVCVLALVMVGAATPIAGQVRPDSATVSRPRPVVPQETPDSLRPPLSPGRAFLNSMFLPGLGQARLGRHVPGAVYFAMDAVSFSMLFKIQHDLRVAKARALDRVVSHYQVDPTTGAPVLGQDGNFVPVDTVDNHFDAEVVDARRAQFEDWVALIIFNHLFAGADAFVASLLWDLPARVGFRPAPTGLGVGISVRW